MRRAVFGKTVEQSAALDVVLACMRMVSALYSQIFYRPFFVLMQACGIAFNLGLLAAMFLKIVTSDIAFGWQSTLQFSAQTLYTIVTTLALPWSWLFTEGSGYPSMAHIEGSRILLKEGIAHLATDSLVSWWPFLVLSLLVYGLGIRLLLFLFGLYAKKRMEKTFIPDTPAVAQILRRMQSPIVTSRSYQEDGKKERTDECREQGTVSLSTWRRVEVLVPSDCVEACDTMQLRQALAEKGYIAEDVHTFQVDYDSDKELLLRLQDTGAEGILLFVESWMVPLMDTLTFLAELRERVGKKMYVGIWLLGKPVPETIFTPVEKKEDMRMWQRKLEAIGDPYLEIVSISA